MGNLIGYICPGMKRMCNVEISQTPTQWNSKCSKLFNLKADGDTTNKKVHNQRVGKKRKRQANSCKKRQANCKKAQSNSAPSFWIRLNLKKSKRELSPAHIKRGYSGPAHMGGFVVVSLCDAWGLPQFSKMLHWLKTMAEDHVWRPLCLIMHDFMLKMCTVCKKRSQLHMLYVQKCVQNSMYKKILVCTNIFYLIFQKSFLLCLDSSKNLWFDAFIKMMIWGATEQSKESFLVSIITLQDTSIR